MLVGVSLPKTIQLLGNHLCKPQDRPGLLDTDLAALVRMLHLENGLQISEVTLHKSETLYQHVLADF